MAEDDGKEKCKQRFKGIENFLRKVAYNLGIFSLRNRKNYYNELEKKILQIYLILC